MAPASDAQGGQEKTSFNHALSRLVQSGKSLLSSIV
jgi:hypothetical protein